METKHTYQVDLEWKENRKGMVTSPELNSAIEVVTPPEFPKGIAGIWSPEHFFVAAIESCFMTTFLAVAENFKLEFSALSCQAVGTLERVERKFMISKVVLKVRLTIGKETDQEKAIKVIDKSEKACLISNSVTSEIVLETEIIQQ